LRFTVVDRPGVLAELTGILAKRGISIAAINQKEHGKEPVSVAVISHRAKRGDVLSAVEEIDGLPIVKGRTKVFHILDLNLTSQEPLLKTA
jgi:homoserine dehydrogenase